MRFARSFLLMISSLVLAVSLLLLPPLLTMRMTVMNRSVVNGWLTDDGFTKAIATQLSDAISQQQAKDHGAAVGEADTSGKLITDAARASLTPDLVKKNSSVVINGIYDWLEGKNKKLAFQVDLTAVITQLGDALVVSTSKEVALLPACPAGTVVNLLKTTCSPTGLDLLTAQQKLRKEILDSTRGVSTSALSADSILLDQNGKSVPIGQALSQLPTWYQRLNIAPFILLILIIAASLIILFSSTVKSESSWTLTTIFSFWGLIYLVIGVLGFWLGGNVGVSLLGAKLADQTVAQAVLPSLVKHISYALSIWTVGVAVVYLLVAGVTLTIRRVAKHRRQEVPLVAGPVPEKPKTTNPPAEAVVDTTPLPLVPAAAQADMKVVEEPKPEVKPLPAAVPPKPKPAKAHVTEPVHRGTPEPVDRPMGVILPRVTLEDLPPPPPPKPEDAPRYEIKPQDQN